MKADMRALHTAQRRSDYISLRLSKFFVRYTARALSVMFWSRIQALLVCLAVTSVMVAASPSFVLDQNLFRRINKNSKTSNQDGDPGIFPGGKSSFLRDGWRVLPPIEGAYIDNSTFKVDDKGSFLTAYVTKDYNASKIKRAVIQVHGMYRDSWNQFTYVSNSLKAAASRQVIQEDEALIITPMFFSVMDKGAYPVNKNNVSSSKALVWDDHTWGDCQNAVLPSYNDDGELANPSYSAKRSDIPVDDLSEHVEGKRALAETSRAKAKAKGPEASAPDALDSIIDFLSDEKKFPNLEKIVLSGFSLGAQLMNRYLAMRPRSPQDSKLLFVISSPASLMYLTPHRPLKVPKDCPHYNNYKYGLDGHMPDYYKRHKKDDSVNDMRKRYLERQQFYFVGMDDTTDTDTSCEARTQGHGHLERMDNWIKELSNLLEYSDNQNLDDTVGYHPVKKVSHDINSILQTEQAQNVFFKFNSGKDMSIPGHHDKNKASCISMHSVLMKVTILVSLFTIILA